MAARGLRTSVPRNHELKSIKSVNFTLLVTCLWMWHSSIALVKEVTAYMGHKSNQYRLCIITLALANHSWTIW